MKTVVGGLIAIVLGIFSFTLFFPAVLNFMAGTIPIFLIIGGCLTLYLKHGEEASDTWEKNNISEASSHTETARAVPTETKSVEPVEPEPELVEPEPVEPEPVEKVTENPRDEILQLFGNTGSLVFHRADCKFANSKKCTAVFNTREKAIQEGYKPCRTCNP